MLEIGTVIGAIARMSSGPIARRLQRTEAVIELCKRFGIDPKQPPDDFDTLYAYALVEYGVYKSRPILNFFRHEYVREAFRQSYYHDDPSILDREAEETIAWNEETKKLGRLNYAPRREFAAFSAVFEDVIQRARTPSAVQRDHNLTRMHADISSRIDELATRITSLNLSEIRNTREELTKARQKTNLETLCNGIEEWFRALGYAVDHNQVSEGAFQEWVIRIPTRRGRFDRIVVRIVEGEASVTDLQGVDASVKRQAADEGWLVAGRRKSQAACDEAVKPENLNRLYCYTFDELLDQVADFSKYLDWLESEVKRHGIDKRYVPLACTKDEIDPLTDERIGQSRYDERNGWIDGYITRWLHDPSKSHIGVAPLRWTLDHWARCP